MRSAAFSIACITSAICAFTSFAWHICIFFLLGFDFFQLSRTQFAIIFLANAAVIMGELINTAVERTVDLHSKGKHPLAKAAKDTAAGAVLVAAIGAVAAGVALLWQPPAFRALYQYYASHPGSLALFAASLVFSFAYIFMGPLKLLGLDKTSQNP